MDDATKTMALTLATGIIKKGLMTLGASASTHGIINGNQTETFVSAGMFLVGVGWSLWNDYGKAIVLSQLEVLKARSLAAAEKIHRAGLPPVTVNEVAAQSATLTPAQVTKVADGMDALVKASVVPVEPTIPAAKFGPLALIAVALLFLGWPDAARAQQPRLTGNIVRDIQAANPTRPNLTGSPLNDIIGALDAKLLPDLQYALKLADASGSRVTGPCYKAWIDIINTRQKAVQAADGTDMPMPDPHIVTEFEKLVELRNSLQPDSEFMIKCSPVASMVKKDIVGFIGLVLSGGAGLATLVPGL